MLRIAKYFAFAVIGLVVTAAAFASGTNENAATSKGPQRLVLWGWPGSSNALQKAMPLFEKKYPNISVKYDYMSWGTVHQKLQIAIQSGSGAPDISWVDGAKIQEFIHRGGLLNVTKYVKSYASDYPSYKIASVTGPNGEIYAFPGDIGPVLMWYNKKIFDTYNLPIPKTWTEYIKDGVTLKQHGIAMVELPPNYISNPQQPVTTIFQLILQEAGGSLYSKAGHASVDSPAGKKALAVFLDMYKAGIGANIQRWTPAEWDAIRSGKVATVIDAGWMMNVFPDYVKKGKNQGYGDWRAAPMPLLEANQLSSADDGGSTLVVPQQTTGNAREAAIKYCVFMTSNLAAQIDWARYGLVPGYLPAYKNPEMKTMIHPMFGNQKLMPLIAAEAKLIPPTYYKVAAYEEGNQYVDSTLSKVISGAVSPDQYLSNLNKQLNSFEAQYQ